MGYAGSEFATSLPRRAGRQKSLCRRLEKSLGKTDDRFPGATVCAQLPASHQLAPALSRVSSRFDCTPCVRWWQGRREDRSCPPRLEELKKEAQGILSPDIFDGARFEFNKTLTQKFQLNHNITLGSSQVPSAYEFGATFGDERVLLRGRTEMSGRVNGLVHAQVSDSTLLRLQTQMNPESLAASSCEARADYKGADFATGAAYVAGGLTLAHCMKSISPNLAVGGEGFYHLHKPLKGASLAARAARAARSRRRPRPRPRPRPSPAGSARSGRMGLGAWGAGALAAWPLASAPLERAIASRLPSRRMPPPLS